MGDNNDHDGVAGDAGGGKQADQAQLRANAVAALVKQLGGRDALATRVEEALFREYSKVNTGYRLHLRAALRIAKLGGAELAEKLEAGGPKAMKKFLGDARAQIPGKEAPPPAAASEQDTRKAPQKKGTNVLDEDLYVSPMMAARLLGAAQAAKARLASSGRDGALWRALGTAYADMFASSNFAQYLMQAVNAFKMASASSDRPQVQCAEMLLRRSVLFRVLEEFDSAVADLEQMRHLPAHLVTPDELAAAAAAEDQIRARFVRLEEAVASRGGVPPKRVQKLASSIRVGVTFRGLTEARTVADLSDGDNDERFLSVVVLAHGPPSELLGMRPCAPLSLVVADRGGSCAIVSVYNVLGTGTDLVPAGSVLTVVKPTLSALSFAGSPALPRVLCRQPSHLFVGDEQWSERHTAISIGDP